MQLSGRIQRPAIMKGNSFRLILMTECPVLVSIVLHTHCSNFDRGPSLKVIETTVNQNYCWKEPTEDMILLRLAAHTTSYLPSRCSPSFKQLPSPPCRYLSIVTSMLGDDADEGYVGVELPEYACKCLSGYTESPWIVKYH